MYKVISKSKKFSQLKCRACSATNFIEPLDKPYYLPNTRGKNKLNQDYHCTKCGCQFTVIKR